MDPVSIAAVGWSIAGTGWVISPIVSKLINRCCSYLGFDALEKLAQLGPKVLQLERVMEVVEGSPDKNRLEQLCKDLKSAFYEAEDILDDIDYHNLKRKIRDDRLKSDESASGSKKSLLMKVQSVCLPICSKKDKEIGMSKGQLKKSLEKIEKVINNACEILERLNLPCLASSDRKQVSAANARSAVTMDDLPKVFGRDAECNRIISMLHDRECDDERDQAVSASASTLLKHNHIECGESELCYSVIGIYGVAGSGKSTLAQYILDQEKKDKAGGKDGHFDLVIRIHVSKKFDLDAIFREMFEGATAKACPTFSSTTVLLDNLKNKLRGEKILLVLDDVWNNIRNANHQAELKQLLSPLKVGKTGSKVLATSRAEDALLALGAAKERCIRISELDDKVFEEMFMHYALEGVSLDDHDRILLRTLGTDIAKKLNRSPLAARTVGAQLCQNPNFEFWIRTKDDDLLKETKGALWWSYRHLDEQAKRCFAYCSIFPRRYHLDRDELVRLWVAEGFIKTDKAGDDMDAIGKGYFDELLSASFLQLGGKHTLFGDKSEYYKVHDLLCDLAEEVAGDDCLKIEKGWTGQIRQDVRHLLIRTYNWEILMDKVFELQNLRTLIIEADPKKKPVEVEVLEHMFKRLLKLRVLIIRYTLPDAFKFPESIGRLKHLRYFGYKVGHLCTLVLPRSLANLYHIQVLDFGGCNTLVFSGSEYVNQLINLRGVISFADPDFPNIGKLTQLQILPFFTVKKEHGYELRQLKDLKKLRGKLQIHGLENVPSKDEAIEANLADKELLRELVLCWGNESCPPEVEAEVLEALCPSKYLKRLQIRDYSGLTHPSWMVGKHEGGPNFLEELELRNWRLGPAPELFEFFALLRVFWLWGCDWSVLPDSVASLKYLKRLWIYDCLNIRALPTMPLSLEEFVLRCCDRVFMESCETTGHQNWEKIRHIPHKEFI